MPYVNNLNNNDNDSNISKTETKTNFEETTIDNGTSQKEQILGFVDSATTKQISIPTDGDETMHYQSYQDASLNEFLSRPIRIVTGSWSVGSDLSTQFDPWNLYFNNAAVLKKLDNFHMMRCNLHIKLIVNGTPFHYSRLIMSYHPQQTLSPQHDPFSFTDIPMRLLKMSNMPHGMLDPSTQEPLSMELPFIKQENYITVEKMVNPTIIGDDLGEISIQSTTTLEAVSATAALAIPYTVFAWAEDVELVIPTHANVSSAGKSKKASHSKSRKIGKVSNAKQKKKGKAQSMLDSASSKVSKYFPITPGDEESNGLVSSVSSTVANVAGKLKDIPLIGSYAGTVAGAANAITGVARFFGFSRPPVFTDTELFKNIPASSVAYTQGNETVSKLTFDPKQGVTMDPSVNAMGPEDELSLKMFTNKESLISTVVWSSSDAEDTELFWANVIPMYTRQTAVTNGVKFSLSSLAFAARPFKYWSGSLNFRFQIVASQFHTGRLRITYEPDGADYNALNYNTTYSEIVDLNGDGDVQFTVPWAQTKPFKSLDTPWFNQMFIPPSGIKNYSPITCNGIIYLTVLNELISPDTLKDVTINVFVSGGDDLQFTVPIVGDNSFAQLSPYVPIASSGVGNDVLNPNKMTSLFGDALNSEEQALNSGVFFGEVVTSFRPLLKRYEHVLSRALTEQSGSVPSLIVTSWQTMNYPPLYGAQDNPGMTIGAYTKTALGNSFNYAPNSLMSYLSTGFIGTRGAVRWKILPNVSDGKIISTLVRRGEVDIINSLDLTVETATVASDSASYNDLNREQAQQVTPIWGGAYFQPFDEGQPIAEIEIPYYNNLRFTATNPQYWGSYTSTLTQPDDRLAEFFEVAIKYVLGGFTTSSYAAKPAIDMYVASGEDFSFVTYLGPCAWYVETAQP